MVSRTMAVLYSLADISAELLYVDLALMKEAGVLAVLALAEDLKSDGRECPRLRYPELMIGTKWASTS
jgi:hypothetical protein